MSQTLRLVIGTLFATLGILAVMAPSSRLLSPASAIATEFGYCLAVIAFLALLPGWRQSRAGQLSAPLNFVAVLLLASPVVKAVQTSSNLSQQFDVRFGTAERQRATFANQARPAALVPAELFVPPSSASVRYERRTFKSSNGQDLTIDIYHPAYPHGPIPGVLVVHGESWQTGEGGELVALNGYLAARDHVVAAITDRSFRSPFPAGRDDVIAALAYLKVHADQFGLDPARVAILGRSVGGHLALLVAYAVHDPAIRGVISLYAPTDLSLWYETSARNGVIDIRRVLEKYLGGSPEHSGEDYEAASPVRFVTRDSPATLIIHGLRDEVVPSEQSERLAGRLEQEEVRHLFVRLPWAMHGCDRNFAGPCGQIATYSIERFLNAVMVEPSQPPPASKKPAIRSRPKAAKVARVGGHRASD